MSTSSCRKHCIAYDYWHNENSKALTNSHTCLCKKLVDEYEGVSILYQFYHILEGRRRCDYTWKMQPRLLRSKYTSNFHEKYTKVNEPLPSQWRAATEEVPLPATSQAQWYSFLPYTSPLQSPTAAQHYWKDLEESWSRPQLPKSNLVAHRTLSWTSEKEFLIAVRGARGACTCKIAKNLPKIYILRYVNRK